MTQIMQTHEASSIEEGHSLSYRGNRYPEVPLPSHRLFMLWGSDKIRKMVRYHHNLLRLSEAGDLLPSDEDTFEFATTKTADFFVEMLSRGRFSPPLIGYPALRMRYFQMTVDEQARDIWLATYKKVIKDMSMPSECIEEFWNWIEPLSVWMINRRTSKAPVERYPYGSIWTDLADFTLLDRCS